MLIHTDKKPFMCDECEQSFRQKQLLKRHKNLYHNPEYIPPQPKEKTHECPNCSKAFRHKGNLMRHLALHDPDSYKDSQHNLRSNDNHQLIDDEEESEDTILPGFDVDETTLDSQALHLTLDANSQQLLNGEQVVVFEVVQVNENSGVHSEDQQYATIDGDQIAISTQKLKTATVGKSNLKAVNLAQSDNYIIQLQSEDDAVVTQLDENSTIIDESTVKKQIEKSNQNDISNCFGFKDEDEDWGVTFSYLSSTLPSSHTLTRATHTHKER